MRKDEHISQSWWFNLEERFMGQVLGVGLFHRVPERWTDMISENVVRKIRTISCTWKKKPCPPSLWVVGVVSMLNSATGTPLAATWGQNDLTNHANCVHTYFLGPLIFVDQYVGDLRCKHGSRIDNTAGANHKEKVTFIQLVFGSIKNLKMTCQEKA